ncbi:MAG: signal recognition particle protein [Christensenellales bacterium]|nr:signal recognition particle protein [Clostridia bacterium]
MALFSGLSERINHIFSKLSNRGALTELEIKQAMREVRIALLEADVNVSVAKQFIADVSEKAVGEQVLKSLTPAQQVIKIVNEQLTELMGPVQSKLKVASKLPTVIMMCGLQGAGKTTMCGKLAVYLKKQGKNPLLVGCDIYRPAAIEQLKVVSGKAKAGFFELGQISPTKIALKAVEYAKANGFDTVVLDTAGRLHIDEKLMAELKDIVKHVEITETLLVVDAMTGQDAVNVAKTFDEQLEITGVIMTKLDGDTRGGATLSIKAVTGKPIKFCGIGEKLEDIEPFYPDRMAGRILGMGDVLTLIDKAQEAISQEEAQEMAKKLREASFDLNDYLDQMEKLKKMGSVKDILAMVPGAGKLKITDEDVNEIELEKNKAIIRSMTPAERSNPKILNYQRRRRIAAGSGTQVQDVNKLIKQFEQSKDMMKRFSGKRGARLPF